MAYCRALSSTVELPNCLSIVFSNIAEDALPLFYQLRVNLYSLVCKLDQNCLVLGFFQESIFFPAGISEVVLVILFSVSTLSWLSFVPIGDRLVYFYLFRFNLL